MCYLLPLVIDDTISQQPDTRHLNLDNITGLQIFGWIEPRTCAARRTCQNDVTCLERAERRQVADEVGDGEYHPVTRIILANFAVHTRDDPQGLRSDLIRGNQPGPERARAVEILSLCHVEFRMTQPIPHGALVVARISQDVRQRLGLRDPSPALPDDHDDLALVIELLGLARSHDRLIVVDERRMRTDEDARIFRPLGTIPVLFVAVGIVDPNAEISSAA